MNRLIFIYGTLKRGHGNHGFMLGGIFKGKARTQALFGLYTSGIPFMVDTRRCRHGDEPTHIHGELWEVTPEMVRELDHLEGHPDAYRRRPIGVWQHSVPFPELSKPIIAEAYIYMHEPPTHSKLEEDGCYHPNRPRLEPWHTECNVY